MALVRVGDDAVISAVMDLFEAVKETKKKETYESVLESIESTLTILIPIVREKNQLNEVLDSGSYDIEKLGEKIKKGAALVRRCSEGKNVCCGRSKRANYKVELEELDQLLKVFCNDALQTQRATREGIKILPCGEKGILGDKVKEAENGSDTRKELKDILDTLIEAKEINEEVQFIRQSLGRLPPPGKTSSTPSSSIQPLPPKQQQATEEIMQVEDNYSGVKFLHAQIKQIYEEMELVRAERERLKALTMKMKEPIDGEFDYQEADSLSPWPQELQVKDIQRAVKDIHADVKKIRDKMEAIHGDIHLGTKDPPKLNITAEKVRGSRAGAGAESYQEMVKYTTIKQVTRKNEQLEGVSVEARGITKDLDPSNSTKTIGTVSDPDETAFLLQEMAAKMEAIHGDIHLGTKDPPKLNIPAGKVRGSRAGAGAESYQGMEKYTTGKQVTRKNEQLEGVSVEVRGITKDLDPSNSTKTIGTVSDSDETAFQSQWMTAKPQTLNVKDTEEKMKRTTGIGMPQMEIVQVESKDGCSDEKDIIRD